MDRPGSAYNLAMLARIFIALCALPGCKKKLWRVLYDLLARSQRSDEWTFMNYGYAVADGDTLQLETADEPDRHCIQLYDHVAGAVNLQRQTVAEVGSGRGGGASYIKRYLGPGRVIGVDLSAQAVALCRARHRIEGLEFRVGDAEHLPLEDSSLDAVVNVESSHCYPSFDRFVSEVERVLRPGGNFLYADFRDRGGVESWRRSLERSGLSLIGETDITSNVLIALERDNERKLAFINRIVPGPFQAAFKDFAGMRGSSVYEGFRTGRLVYLTFVLKKTLSPACNPETSLTASMVPGAVEFHGGRSGRDVD
jgi:SAM-dependent methyltransferase